MQLPTDETHPVNRKWNQNVWLRCDTCAEMWKKFLVANPISSHILFAVLFYHHIFYYKRCHQYAISHTYRGVQIASIFAAHLTFPGSAQNHKTLAITHQSPAAKTQEASQQSRMAAGADSNDEITHLITGDYLTTPEFDWWTHPVILRKSASCLPVGS